MSNHKLYAEKAAKDIPVLEEMVNSSWRKEGELKKLKSELSALDRKIQLSLNDKQNDQGEKEKIQVNGNGVIEKNMAVVPKM